MVMPTVVPPLGGEGGEVYANPPTGPDRLDGESVRAGAWPAAVRPTTVAVTVRQG